MKRRVEFVSGGQRWAIGPNGPVPADELPLKEGEVVLDIGEALGPNQTPETWEEYDRAVRTGHNRFTWWGSEERRKYLQEKSLEFPKKRCGPSDCQCMGARCLCPKCTALQVEIKDPPHKVSCGYCHEPWSPRHRCMPLSLYPYKCDCSVWMSDPPEPCPMCQTKVRTRAPPGQPPRKDP